LAPTRKLGRVEAVVSLVEDLGGRQRLGVDQLL
jgi:hypothetical protein